MANIALFVPFEDMLEKAKKVIEKRQFEIAILKHIETYNAIEEARNAVDTGIDIIVARGRQAKLIKKYTNIPLVEIRFHSQEIGLMILKAKKLVKKSCPHIGLIVYNNMLCDMSHMEELFQARLSICYIDEAIDAAIHVKELQHHEADIIIGGEVVCQIASEVGIPALLYESMETSIAEALETAEHMAYAQEAEKHNSAQFAAILDNIVNGIIKISLDGTISLINRHIETLLGKRSSNVIGESIYKLFPQIEQPAIQEILEGKRDSYATSINIHNRPWVLVVSPIQYDSKITGAILAFHTTNKIAQTAARNGILNGYTATTTFEEILTKNAQMNQTLSLAKMYAISNSPVLICGQVGTEYYQIAEAIHNNSNRKTGAFVSINVNGLDEQQQIDVILGGSIYDPKNKELPKGALVKAHYGTLLLCGAEHLTPWIQHELCQIMLEPPIARTEAQHIGNLDVRIIAVTHKNLIHLLNSHQFSGELFYRLQGLTLNIPPLNQRPEDLTLYFNQYFQQFCKEYNRYFKITDGAYRKLSQLKWNGNLIQLKTFAERLVITTRKHSIDEVQITGLFDELYPSVCEIDGTQRMVVYRSPEAAELQELMEKYHGNRAKIAEELGISTTTLWRRMKKYGIL